MIIFLMQLGATVAFGQRVQLTTQYIPNVLAIAQGDTVVYAGMDSGIFISAYHGVSWNLSSMTGPAVRALFLTNSRIFTGTDRVFLCPRTMDPHGCK